MAVASAVERSSFQAVVSGLKAKPTVVFIGGFFGRPYQLQPLRTAVERRCDFNTILYHYNARDHMLVDHAYHLAELLRMLQQHSRAVLPCGDSEGGVHFVCHSFGALVLRAALGHVSYQHMRCRTVMIAPTNNGCWFARAVLSGSSPTGMVGQSLLGPFSGSLLSSWSPENISGNVPNLPKSFPALVLCGTANRSWGTPFLPLGICSDGILMEWETVLRTPALYAHVPSSHTLMLYHHLTRTHVTQFLTDPGKWAHTHNVSPR